MKYKKIPELTPREIEEALNSNNITRISEAILALALHNKDFYRSQDVILRYAEGDNLDLKFIAIQSIGHLGRRFKNIDKVRVLPILKMALVSEDKDIIGSAEDTIDDLKIFVKDFSLN